MGRIVKYNQPCVKGACQSSDAVQIYEDGAHCYSCGKTYDYEKEYRIKNGQQAEVKYSVDNHRRKDYHEDLSDIASLPTMGWSERMITKKAAEFFDCKVSYDSNGEIEKFYFPFFSLDGTSIVGYKSRDVKVKENMRAIGAMSNLFGMNKFLNGGKRIIITEGEVDTLTIAGCSLQKWGSVYPVVSMGGVAHTKYLLENRDTLRKYDEIILYFDNDEKGQEASQKAARILGADKVKMVRAPEKDANETLMKYGAEAGSKKIWNYIFDAKPWSPAGLVAGEDTWELFKAYEDLTYVPWPPFLSRLGELTYGRALGTITMFAAGCHGYGTEFLMYDGSIKQVQDLVVGDEISGPDSSKRIVTSTARGRQTMYRISGPNTYDYVCNEDHVLSLVYTKEQKKYKGIAKGTVVNVSLKEYLTWDKTKKHSFKQYLGDGFVGIEKKLLIDPWILGVWIGDGTEANGAVTNSDEPIWNKIRKSYEVTDNDLKTKTLRGLKSELSSLGLLNNKHIPEEYLTASHHQRLELLAGLIDTDGHLGHSGFYEITQVRQELSTSILRLVKGLGFRASLVSKWSKQWGKFYYKVTFWGKGVPCVVEKKIYREQNHKKGKNFQFKVEPLGEGAYYGVTVDKDSLYQLANGVVTHNTSVGKSSLLREDIYHLLKTTNYKIGACFLEEDVGETTAGIMGLHINKRIGLPTVKVTEEEKRSAWEATVGLEGRTIFLNHQGSVSDNSLIDKIEYMALSGCKIIYLDHITIAISESEGESINAATDRFMSQLLRLVKRYGFWIGVVSHLRKVKGGEDSFESGAPISEDDLKGSGSLKQVSFQTIALSRNKYSETEAVRNRTAIFLLKDRKTGESGPAGGYRYEKDTGRMKEAKKEDFETDDNFELIT